MFSPSKVMMMSPTAISLAPFELESGNIQTQDSIDEKHQPEINNWLKTEEQQLDPKPARFRFKMPRFDLTSSNNPIYNHQNDSTVNAIKKWYQIRGWSLLYPLIMSFFLTISELEFDLRMLGYAFVTSSCVFCFIHLKNFETHKNFGFKVLTVLSVLVILGDFLHQFNIIGDQGWASAESYQSCFNLIASEKNQGFQKKICGIFKAAYYLNSLVYLTTMASLGIYFLGTSKLMKLVYHREAGNGSQTKFEDEFDPED